MNRSCLSLIFLLLGIFASSQDDFEKKYEIRTHVGYGIIGLDKMMFYQYEQFPGHRNFIHKYRSFGQGAYIDIMLGRMFENGTGLEAGFSYVHTTIATHSKILFGDGFRQENMWTATAPVLNVGITYRLQRSTWIIMGSTGVSFSAHTRISNDDNIKYVSGKYPERESTMVYSGGFAYGFYTACEVRKEIGLKWSLSLELKASSLTYLPAQSELVKSEVGGKDQLPGIYPKYKKTIYTRKIKSFEGDFDKPNLSSPVEFPFGALYLNFGLAYTFYKAT